MKIERGMVHVYTGAGKGKTTAALGLAVRALGWGLKVMVVQFIKGYRNTGEMKFAETIPDNLTIRQFALDTSRDIDEKKVLERRRQADEAMAYAESVVSSGAYDVVVLDELSVAMHYGLVDRDRVLEMIGGRPGHVELVVTGRDAPQELVDAADYVTDMGCVRHPYERGIQARPGVDY